VEFGLKDASIGVYLVNESGIGRRESLVFNGHLDAWNIDEVTVKDMLVPNFNRQHQKR
jgi:hypothetical protein